MAGPKQIPIAQYIQKRQPRTFLTSSTRGSATSQPGKTQRNHPRIEEHNRRPQGLGGQAAMRVVTTCSAAAHAPHTPAPSKALTSE